MMITLTFGWLTVCTVLSLALWAGLILWPCPAPSGGYDFGPAIKVFLRLVGGVIATLVIWLVYFALLH